MGDWDSLYFLISSQKSSIRNRFKDNLKSHLKNRILVQDSVFASSLRRDKRDGAEFQTAGILLYVEDLKRGTNKDIGPKGIFEMAFREFFDRIPGTSRSCVAQTAGELL